MDYFLILYFGAGVLFAFFSTIQLQLVVQRMAIAASLFTSLVQIINVLVIYNIVGRLTADRSLFAVAVYSFGIACGTYFALKLKPLKSN